MEKRDNSSISIANNGEAPLNADTDIDQELVVADMSGIDRQPMLFPKFGQKDPGGVKDRRQTDYSARTLGRGDAGAGQPAREVDREERRILLKAGVLSALAAAAIFGIPFALAILLIEHL